MLGLVVFKAVEVISDGGGEGAAEKVPLCFIARRRVARKERSGDRGWFSFRVCFFEDAGGDGACLLDKSPSAYLERDDILLSQCWWSVWWPKFGVLLSFEV